MGEEEEESLCVRVVENDRYTVSQSPLCKSEGNTPKRSRKRDDTLPYSYSLLVAPINFLTGARINGKFCPVSTIVPVLRWNHC